jgi:hypothetical protein
MRVRHGKCPKDNLGKGADLMRVTPLVRKLGQKLPERNAAAGSGLVRKPPVPSCANSQKKR